jgi:hypothetical protein
MDDFKVRGTWTRSPWIDPFSMCLKLLRVHCVYTNAASDNCKMTFADDRGYDLFDIRQTGWNKTCAESGKPRTLSSQPSVGLICVASVL